MGGIWRKEGGELQDSVERVVGLAKSEGIEEGKEDEEINAYRLVAFGEEGVQGAEGGRGFWFWSGCGMLKGSII